MKFMRNAGQALKKWQEDAQKRQDEWKQYQFAHLAARHAAMEEAADETDGDLTSLPSHIMFEKVREYPRGIKLLKETPEKIKLRFLSLRASLAVPLICGFVLWVLIAAVFVQGMTYDDGMPSEWTWLIVCVVLAGFVWLIFPRVVVVITKDWVKVGSKYYLMRHVEGITTGQQVQIQFKNSASPIPLTYIRVAYGPWGEATDYVNSPGTAMDYAVYITSIIERMRTEQVMHETEQGQREQKF
ncbi:MAG: hypothetical protein AAFR74_05500 [Pseudomonadota bacterium]